MSTTRSARQNGDRINSLTPNHSNCLFCRIASHALPADIVWENDDLIVFHDIHPKAPTHVLIVPKTHVTSLADATASDAPLLGRLVWTAGEIARKLGVEKDGYRVIINTRRHAGQAVDHLHLHLLAGRPLGPMVSG